MCVSRVNEDLLQNHSVCIYTEVCVDAFSRECSCRKAFIFVLSYSNVQSTSALNQGEICREIGLIQYTESYEGNKRSLNPKLIRVS